MLECRPISKNGYSPFGDVIEAAGSSIPANQGTAERFNFLSGLDNLRLDAKPNLCVYRCSPVVRDGFSVRLLERHRFSTQVFIPMGGVSRYLAVVALGERSPDLSTLCAFVVEKNQGISYRPGVWHHPMLVLDSPGDLACVVFEDGTSGDNEILSLAEPIALRLP